MAAGLSSSSSSVFSYTYFVQKTVRDSYRKRILKVIDQ